jgi:hypothetical protein
LHIVRNIVSASVVSACFLLATPAFAQGNDARLTASVSAGSLGVGPELAYRLSDTIGIRGNASLLSVSHDFDSDDLTYDGKVKLRSAGVMLDVYPFGGGFRISGGARINGNKGRVIAAPTSAVTINGTSYTPAQIGTLRGEAEVKDFAPALTLGYGGGMGRGFAFGVEAGALFQGKVKMRNFTSSSGLVSAADLEAERQSIQDDVDDYKLYPILQFSLGYRF